MPRFVVLLRGVNVGKGNRVPMATFKELLENLGCTSVRTLLNSGNAVFASTRRSPTKHASRISLALADSLGVRVPVLVKTAAEIEAVVAANPIVVPESDHSRFLVAFAPDAAALAGLEPLRSLAQSPERFLVGADAAYLHCVDGILASKVGAALVGKSGALVTTRNWATVLKLKTLCDATAG